MRISRSLRRTALGAAVAIASMSVVASAQPGTISTYAGGSFTTISYEDRLNYPFFAAPAPDGSVIIADTHSHQIIRVSPSGARSVVAGNGMSLPSGDGTYSGDGGPAGGASLNFPYGVTVDPAGNVFIADSQNHRIRKVDAATGYITTVAGNGVPVYAGDGGPATRASINYPRGVAIDASGNLLIADTRNQRIRKVTPSGTITSVAGVAASGFSGDGGPATSARLNQPMGVGADGNDVLIADTYNQRIRRVSSTTGVITTFAGNGVNSFSGDGGQATSASLSFPYSVTAKAGTAYIADTSNHRIRKVVGGVITTVAGNSIRGYTGDYKPATGTSLNTPFGVTVNSNNELFIADTYNGRVRKVDTGGTMTTVAGTGLTRCCNDEGGDPRSLNLEGPWGIDADASGVVYISDSANHRVLKVSQGIATRLAGIGSAGSSGDSGPAVGAALRAPRGLAADAAGSVYIADTGNHVIRKVSPTGIITTVAGTGVAGNAGDGGTATSASFSSPSGVAVSSTGVIYVADTGNHAIRAIGTDGTVTRVAGGSGPGRDGDGGPAVGSLLDSPMDIDVSASGELFIADTGNDSIRRIDPNGVIHTIAGGREDLIVCDPRGTVCAYTDQPSPPPMSGPQGVEISPWGGLIVADTGNHRVIEVGLDGTIRAFAGLGVSGYLGDGGDANSALLNLPTSICVTPSGHVLISDRGNARIRSVEGP